MDSDSVSRFVFDRRHIYGSVRVKPAAFIPYPHRGTSVSLHARRAEGELWKDGQTVADGRCRPLLGRAEFTVGDVRESQLTLRPEPTPTLPFHAEIEGWAAEKAAQKNQAMLLADRSGYYPFNPA